LQEFQEKISGLEIQIISLKNSFREKEKQVQQLQKQLQVTLDQQQVQQSQLNDVVQSKLKAEIQVSGLTEQLSNLDKSNKVLQDKLLTEQKETSKIKEKEKKNSPTKKKNFCAKYPEEMVQIKYYRQK